MWARKAGSFSGGNFDTGTGIGADAAGNVYVTGTFLSPVADFGGVLLTNLGSGDIFLSKYDPAGTLQWVRQAGGSGDDRPNGIAVDAAGNAHIVGEFSGTAGFGVTNLASAGGAADVFIAKFNPSGTAIWAQAAGGQSADAARGVAVDPAGNVHVTGYFGGAASFGAIRLSGIVGTYDDKTACGGGHPRTNGAHTHGPRPPRCCPRQPPRPASRFAERRAPSPAGKSPRHSCPRLPRA